MVNDSVLVVFLSLATMICWGIANGLMKRPSLSIGSARAIRIRQYTMTACALLVYLLVSGFSLPSFFWGGVSLLLGMFGYVPFYFFCQALQIGRVGIVHAIGNSFPLIVAFLSVTFLGVTLTLFQILGIIISISGVITLSLGKNRTATTVDIELSNHLRACLLSVCACILWGLFFTLVQIPNSVIGFVSHTLIIQTGCLVAAELHIYMARIPRRNISKKVLLNGFFAGTLAIIGSFSFYKALSLGNPGIVTTFAGSSPVVAAAFGYFFLNETLKRKEMLGIALAVVGVLLLSTSKLL
jgi:drug/metabolite transporter (DMT)-like permease